MHTVPLMKGWGIGKLASPYFTYCAVKQLGGGKYLMATRWQQLEILTHLMLITANCKTVNKSESLIICQTTSEVVQRHIGEVPHRDIAKHVVTLLINIGRRA